MENKHPWKLLPTYTASLTVTQEVLQGPMEPAVLMRKELASWLVKEGLASLVEGPGRKERTCTQEEPLSLEKEHTPHKEPDLLSRDKVEGEQWLAALSPSQASFTCVCWHVDWDGLLTVTTPEQQAIMKLVCAVLESKYRGSEPGPQDKEGWQVGQLCVGGRAPSGWWTGWWWGNTRR